ncbi:hypothetical protein PDP59_25200, partial [Escherichia coli]|nr:hypothetical protein [Escherichia coli]
MLAKVTFLSCLPLRAFPFSGSALACFVPPSGLSRRAGPLLSPCSPLSPPLLSSFLPPPPLLLS